MVELSLQRKIFAKKCSLDELLHLAVELNQGKLALSHRECGQLMALLERQAERVLDPGDKIRLDCVTLVKDRYGTTTVRMKI